jgi:hypothetical protein
VFALPVAPRYALTKVGGADTVTVQGELDTVPILALTFAAPAATAMASPELAMSSMAGLPLDQIIAAFAMVADEPSEYVPVAVNCKL